MYNLLIVDDEWIIANSLSTMEEWGQRNIYVVGTASNGVEALSYIEQNTIDIMITDIQMPQMDGLELLKTIRLLNPDIKIIMISGYEQFQYVHFSLKHKAKGYILKPIDTDELLQLVDEIIQELEQNSNTVQQSIQEEEPKTQQEVIVLRTTDYLKQNLGKQISLHDVAELFSLSPQYFGQLFKSASGESFTKHLMGLRMERACELLKNYELKSYHICREVGYHDVKYFAQQFRRYYKMNPKEYRQQYFQSRKLKIR